MPRVWKYWKYCRKCGSECVEYESGNVVCPSCKKQVIDYDTEPHRRKPKRTSSKPLATEWKPYKICAYCGYANWKTKRFCVRCGKKLK